MSAPSTSATPPSPETTARWYDAAARCRDAIVALSLARGREVAPLQAEVRRRVAAAMPELWLIDAYEQSVHRRHHGSTERMLVLADAANVGVSIAETPADASAPQQAEHAPTEVPAGFDAVAVEALGRGPWQVAVRGFAASPLWDPPLRVDVSRGTERWSLAFWRVDEVSGWWQLRDAELELEAGGVRFVAPGKELWVGGRVVLLRHGPSERPAGPQSVGVPALAAASIERREALLSFLRQRARWDWRWQATPRTFAQGMLRLVGTSGAYDPGIRLEARGVVATSLHQRGSHIAFSWLDPASLPIAWSGGRAPADVHALGLQVEAGSSRTSESWIAARYIRVEDDMDISLGARSTAVPAAAMAAALAPADLALTSPVEAALRTDAAGAFASALAALASSAAPAPEAPRGWLRSLRAVLGAPTVPPAALPLGLQAAQGAFARWFASAPDGLRAAASAAPQADSRPMGLDDAAARLLLSLQHREPWSAVAAGDPAVGLALQQGIAPPLADPLARQLGQLAARQTLHDAVSCLSSLQRPELGAAIAALREDASWCEAADALPDRGGPAVHSAAAHALGCAAVGLPPVAMFLEWPLEGVGRVLYDPNASATRTEEERDALAVADQLLWLQRRQREPDVQRLSSWQSNPSQAERLERVLPLAEAIWPRWQPLLEHVSLRGALAADELQLWLDGEVDAVRWLRTLRGVCLGQGVFGVVTVESAG